jgi:ferredoxin
VIAAFNCDYSRPLHYALSLLFIQLLVRLAVCRGGHPYGIGIWNTPFVSSKFTDGQLARLKQKKEAADPKKILNPNKFFKIKGRFLSIPALAMHPQVFRAILAICQMGAPVLGLLARFTAPEKSKHWQVPGSSEEQGKRLLFESSQRCTSCGACISVCPAYHITHDELVTGRTKLRMAETMMNGGPLQQTEAFTPFQCLHCGLCEEVCQTRLPLRDCYLVLEDWIEKRFGAPSEIVEGFVEQLDQNREFINHVFGLDIPDWSPEEKLSRVPMVEPSREGESK